MNKYNTKQQELILNYLKQNHEKDLSAQMIVNYIIKKNKQCSQTTVYRQLKRLVEEGVVDKYYIDSNSVSSYYKYIKDNKCKEHFHFRCEKCGKTMHLENNDLEKIETALEKEYKVKLDPSKTVLYGKCNGCI